MRFEKGDGQKRNLFNRFDLLGYNMEIIDISLIDVAVQGLVSEYRQRGGVKICLVTDGENLCCRTHAAKLRTISESGIGFFMKNGFSEMVAAKAADTGGKATQ